MRLEPIGPTLADNLAPGGKFAEIGVTLRHYDAELARLADAGVPLAATAGLLAARADLLAYLSVLDAAEPRLWRVTTGRNHSYRTRVDVETLSVLTCWSWRPD